MTGQSREKGRRGKGREGSREKNKVAGHNSEEEGKKKRKDKEAR